MLYNKKTITIIITFVIIATSQLWRICKQTSIDFDLKLFIIILILASFLAYNLIIYIQDFKTSKHQSRLDIIFLNIFFIFLFIPMSHINQDEISIQENRTLAKWQPLINQNGKINYDFGKNFNEWFNDRFYLRNLLIALSDYKLYFAKNWQTKDVIKGKDGWLFLGWKKSINNYSNNFLYTNEELSKMTDSLISINNYCKKHNKKFYFFIAPDKSSIYGEFYNSRIKKKSSQSKTKQLIEYINATTDIKIIYPQERLLSEKDKNKSLLYYKQDTHWTMLGAYYGYLELMNAVKKDFSNIELYKPLDSKIEHHNGDLHNMTPKILRTDDNSDYIVPNVKMNDICNEERQTRGQVICNNINGKYNLLMLRDSFAKFLIPYFAYTFQNSKYVWGTNISPIDMQNADVIILEIVEREVATIMDNFMEE